MHLALKSSLRLVVFRDFSLYSTTKKNLYSEISITSKVSQEYYDFSFQSSVKYNTIDGFSLKSSVGYGSFFKHFFLESETTIGGYKDFYLREIRREGLNKHFSFASNVRKNGWKEHAIKCSYIQNGYSELWITSSVEYLPTDKTFEFSLMSSVRKNDILTLSSHISTLTYHENLYTASQQGGSGAIVTGTVSPLVTGKFRYGVERVREDMLKVKVVAIDTVGATYSFIMRAKTYPISAISDYHEIVANGVKIFGEVFSTYSDMVTLRIIEDTKQYILDDGTQFVLDLRMSKSQNFLKTNHISPLNRQPFYISNSYFGSFMSAGWDTNEEVLLSTTQASLVEHITLITIASDIKSVHLGRTVYKIDSSAEHFHIGHSTQICIGYESNKRMVQVSNSSYSGIISPLDIFTCVGPGMDFYIGSADLIKEEYYSQAVSPMFPGVVSNNTDGLYFMNGSVFNIETGSTPASIMSKHIEWIEGDEYKFSFVGDVILETIEAKIDSYYEDIVTSKLGDDSIEDYHEEFATLRAVDLIITEEEDEIASYHEEYANVSIIALYGDIVYPVYNTIYNVIIENTTISASTCEITAKVISGEVLEYSIDIYKARILG